MNAGKLDWPESRDLEREYKGRLFINFYLFT